jgi:hypothetical protein
LVSEWSIENACSTGAHPPATANVVVSKPRAAYKKDSLPAPSDLAAKGQHMATGPGTAFEKPRVGLACAVVLTFSVTLLVAIAVTNRTKPTTSSTVGLLRQDQYSYLTHEGVQQIKDNRRARFDLRDLTLTNEEAGVPPESTSDVIIGNPGDPDLTLVGPTGEVTINTQTIWFTHLDEDTFPEIIFWRSFDTPEGAQQELAQANPRWESILKT